MTDETRSSALTACAALLLLVLTFRLIDTAAHQSFTADEPHYVGTGLYLWSSGDYDFKSTLRFHPPLAFHLASVPLLAIDLGEIELSPKLGAELMHSDRVSTDLLRVASRLPFALVTIWGAVLAGLWAFAIAGRSAGLGALFLYSTSPALLAYGSLVHNDILVSVLFLQTLFLAWRWRQAPSAGRLVLAGLSLGLALAAKVSALLLLASLALLMLANALRSDPASAQEGNGRARRVGAALAQGAAMVAIASVVIWISYGGSFALAEGIRGGSLEGVVLPAYLQSLFFDVDANTIGRPIYLAGEFSQTGWWYFLPLAFLLKTPLPTLLLLALAIVTPRKLGSAGPFLWVPTAVYALVVCFWLQVPLGLRYILPVYPLLSVWIACRLLPTSVRWRQVFVAAAALWLVVSGARVHPHYLAYFNEAAGGPARGHEWMAESNLDWGQALPALAETLREQGNPPIYLAYFGVEDPARFGIESTPLRGCQPVEGIVAISVNVLKRLYSPANPFAQPPEGCYDWLAASPLIAQPGYAIHVYDTRGRRGSHNEP